MFVYQFVNTWRIFIITKLFLIIKQNISCQIFRLADTYLKQPNFKVILTHTLLSLYVEGLFLHKIMAYVITDNCICCKYTDCVEVCPVDCFYEGKNFLVINPNECIDCGVCEPECPAGAIKSSSETDIEK